jgi:thermostable 8-oxoguanine DNA glycosylase
MTERKLYTVNELDNELKQTYREIAFCRKTMNTAKLECEAAKQEYKDAFDFLALQQEELKRLLSIKESMNGIPDWEPQPLRSNTH